jgi:transposase
MGKNNRTSSGWQQETGLTIGIDLGDKVSSYCVRGAEGEIRQEDRVRTNSIDLSRIFGSLKPSRIVIEVGTHSPWVSRKLTELGHQVIVGNPRQLKLISASDKKSDRVDARLLSELGHSMPRLLNAVRHRSAEAQADLAVIRARARLVEARTKLWNTLRSTAKSLGDRLPRRVKAEDLDRYDVALKPLWEVIVSIGEKIKDYDAAIEHLVQTKYPEAIRLQQVAGVGPIISLTFILTIDYPQRFRRSRDVGSYLGLRPRQQDSGERSPQLSITRAGDRYLRQMLVQGAHYVLWNGPDTNLQRWGKKLAASGGKKGKKRAVVAVARKLGILLLRLWVSGETYDPFHSSRSLAAVV